MSAMVELVGGGIGMMPDPEDNHVATHHETGAGISFKGLDADDAGTGVDNILVNQWESRHLDPEQGKNGYVSLGRLYQARHTVLIFVNPGSGQSIISIHFIWSESVCRNMFVTAQD